MYRHLIMTSFLCVVWMFSLDGQSFSADSGYDGIGDNAGRLELVKTDLLLHRLVVSAGRLGVGLMTDLAPYLGFGYSDEWQATLGSRTNDSPTCGYGGGFDLSVTRDDIPSTKLSGSLASSECFYQESLTWDRTISFIYDDTYFKEVTSPQTNYPLKLNFSEVAVWDSLDRTFTYSGSLSCDFRFNEVSLSDQFYSDGLVIYSQGSVFDEDSTNWSKSESTPVVRNSTGGTGSFLIAKRNCDFNNVTVKDAPSTRTIVEAKYIQNVDGGYEISDEVRDERVQAAERREVVYASDGQGVITQPFIQDSDTVIRHATMGNLNLSTDTLSESSNFSSYVIGLDRDNDGTNDVLADAVVRSAIGLESECVSSVQRLSEITVVGPQINVGDGVCKKKTNGFYIDELGVVQYQDLNLDGINELFTNDDDQYGIADTQEAIDGTDPLDATDCINCEQPVSGIAYHWNNHALLESVSVDLVGLEGSLVTDFKETADPSDASGRYVFTKKHVGTNQLTATKDITPEESVSAISSADALAALKIAVGINPNTDPDGNGPLVALPVSPYQYIAADINGDGRITSADALAILRMAVKLDSAEPRRWVFVAEDYEFWHEASESFLTTRTDVTWNNSRMTFEYPEKNVQNIVGVLMGDVDGNWRVPEGGGVVADSHFLALITSQGGSLAQWGLGAASGEDDFGDAPPDTNTFPGVTWESSAPNDVNVDKEGVDQALDYAFSPGRNTQGVVIIRHGVIIGERYADGESKDSLATSWSTGKSFASALIGIALDRDFIDSIDVPAETYLTPWMDTDKGEISIRAILEMRSGLKQSRANIYFEGNQLAFALAREPETTPRTDNWAYQNEDSMLLGGILEAATGQSVLDFADINLFSKIGMQADWWTDAYDHTLTYCCIDATSRDFARFGLLYARNGRWLDDQIIPENWVKKSTTAPEGSVTRNYAMQWWVRPAQGYFMALGYHANNIYVFQDQDLVVVRNSLYTKVGSSSVITGNSYHQTQPPSSWSDAVFLSYITNAIND